MGLWGAAQAIAAGFGGLTGAAIVDVIRDVQTDAAAFGLVFGFEAACSLPPRSWRGRIMGQGVPMPYAVAGGMIMYDVVIVAAAASGATAANDLARSGARVAFLDKAGRIKPCGGAIPPQLIADFDIPDAQIVARITTARMISPTQRQVDIPIENGFVGMVDREHFDEFLRKRAQQAGAERFTGTYLRLERNELGTRVMFRDKASGETRALSARLVIGADGARSNVGRQEVPGGDKIPYVIAYHEIIEAPRVAGRRTL